MLAGCSARQTKHCWAGAWIKVPKQIRHRKWWHGPLGRIMLLGKWVRQWGFQLRGWGSLDECCQGLRELEVWTEHCSAARHHSLYHVRHGNIISIFFSLQDQSLLKPFKQQWNNSLFVLCGLCRGRRDRDGVLRSYRIHFTVPHPSLKVETIFPLSVNSISGESANHYKISFFPTLITPKGRIFPGPCLR